MESPKTVLKALALLEIVRANPDQRLKDLATLSQTPAPTCARLLSALSESRLVRRNNDTYNLGPQCLALGESFRATFTLTDECHPYLARLSADTGETAHLGVIDGLQCIYLDKVDSTHSVRMYSRIGARSPLHSTGIGKALLSASPEEFVENVCAAGLSRRTPRTITDPKELRDELAAVRARGYAIDDVENEIGIRCLAAPVRGSGPYAIAAVSVAGPDSRVTIDVVRDIAAFVVQAANELSVRAGHTGRPLEANHEDPPK